MNQRYLVAAWSSRFGVIAGSLCVSLLPALLAGCASEDPSQQVEGQGLEGELKVLAVDGDAGPSLKYELHTATRVYELEFAAPPEIVPNSRVTVVGSALPKEALEPEWVHRLKVESIRPIDQGSDVGTISQALGSSWNRKVAMVLLNWRNRQQQPLTVSKARDMMFTGSTSVSAYYKEQSFGLTTLTGDVFGWVTVDYDDTTCNQGAWSTNAYNKLVAQGVDLSGYQNVSYYFPYTSACGYGGLGYQPGSTSWINGQGVGAIAHELGHNFGLSHASTNPCSGVSVNGTDCWWDDYGDVFDVMGFGGGVWHMNAYHKGQLGWFDSANTATVTTSSAQFDVAPIESFSAGVQSVRVAIPGTQNFYYAEYRKRYGFDDYGNGTFLDGLLIHRAPAYSTGVSPVLIDSTPETSTFWDAQLVVGKTFSDSKAGVSISLLGKSATTAQVRVTGGTAGTTVGNGVYAFSNQSNGLCAGVPSNTSNGSYIQESTCVDSLAQRFYVTDKRDGKFELKNLSASKCMNLAGGSSSDGAKLEQWDCYVWDSELFYLPGNSATSALKNISSNKCVEVPSGGSVGSALQQSTCSAATNQKWTLNPVSSTATTLEAESANGKSGVSVWNYYVYDVGDNEWLAFNNVNLNALASFQARVASNNLPGSIEFRRDSPTGLLLATCAAPNTGGWEAWTTVSCNVKTGVSVSGSANLYAVFHGLSANNQLPNVDWLKVLRWW